MGNGVSTHGQCDDGIDCLHLQFVEEVGRVNSSDKWSAATMTLLMEMPSRLLSYIL